VSKRLHCMSFSAATGQNLGSLRSRTFLFSFCPRSFWSRADLHHSCAAKHDNLAVFLRHHFSWHWHIWNAQKGHFFRIHGVFFCVWRAIVRLSDACHLKQTCLACPCVKKAAFRHYFFLSEFHKREGSIPEYFAIHTCLLPSARPRHTAPDGPFRLVSCRCAL